MANNVLFCQKCATPHEANFPWIIWSDFRLDSPQCRDQLIRNNADVLYQEKITNAITRRIAKSLQKKRIAEPIAKEKPSNLDKFVFYKPKKRKKTWLRRGFYKKNVNCLSCNTIIPKTCRKCLFCQNYTKSHLIDFDYPTKKRNQEIVSLLAQGIYTLEQVGKMYGFSRERTRQIYFKLTGKNYTLRKQKLDYELKMKHIAQQETRMKEVKFSCLACSKLVTYREAGSKHQYCNNCHSLAMEQFRDPSIKFACKNCQIEFYPQRNWKSSKTKPKFCTMRCYMQSDDFVFKKRRVNVDMAALLDKWYSKQNSFDTFYFKYRTQGLRPLGL